MVSLTLHEREKCQENELVLRVVQSGLEIAVSVCCEQISQDTMSVHEYKFHNHRCLLIRLVVLGCYQRKIWLEKI